MADYLIDGSKLTALGDALREKNVVKTFVGEQVFYSKVFNGDGSLSGFSGYYEGKTSDTSTTKYAIEGADYLEITFKTYMSSSASSNTIGFWYGDGVTTSPKMASSALSATPGFIYFGTLQQDTVGQTIRINSSSVYFGFYIGSNQNGIGYWVDVKGYKEVPSTTKMTIDEMTQKIKNINNKKLKTIRIFTYAMGNGNLYIKLKDYVKDYSQIQSILMTPRNVSSLSQSVAAGGYYIKDLCWRGVTTKTKYSYGLYPESYGDATEVELILRMFAIFRTSGSETELGVANIGQSPDELGVVDAYAFLIDSKGRLHTPYYLNTDHYWKPAMGSYYQLYITYYEDQEEE